MVKSGGNLWSTGTGFVCFLVIALAHVSAQNDGPAKWTPTWADRLRKDLFKDYDPSMRPSQHYNVTTVETSITVTHVEINEIKSTLSVYGWMKFNWNDSRLAWNPELYENKTVLYVNQSVVWHPTQESSTLVTLTNNGEVQHASVLRKESKCALQWAKWPFDTQHCKMSFSPWIEHDDMEIHVALKKHEVTQGTLWSLNNVILVTYVSNEENGSLAQRGTYLQFEMKRNSRIYGSTIIVPACTLILMSLINFWLPPNCGEKLILNAINVLVACMFLIHFNEYLSYFTSTTPTIVLFYSHSLYLSGMCLLMNVLIERMLKTGSKVPAPAYVSKLISHAAIASMISISGHQNNQDDQMCETLEDIPAQESMSYMEEVHSSAQKKSDSYQDWLLFATLLNRIAFIVYVIIFTLMSWNDPKLTWDPANYGNLDVVRLDPTIVWRPDVVLYNNAGGSDNHHYGDTNVLVYSPGNVLWVPPTEYHAFCELNMRLWPFDHQKCIVKIGSWTFDGYKLNLTVGDDPAIETLVKNSEWKILKVDTERHTTFYPCCTEPYIDITYNVTLQRQSDTHRAIVVIPALVIIVFALSVFWLPLHAGERIIMNGIIALMITLFLIYFAQQLPAIAGLTPLIVIFFSNTLLLTAFSTIISVIVLNMTKTKHERSLPNILRRVAGCVGPFVGVGKKHFIFSDKGSVTIESNTEHEWSKFGLVLNRLSFLVYCVIFVICAFYSL